MVTTDKLKEKTSLNVYFAYELYCLVPNMKGCYSSVFDPFAITAAMVGE